MRLLETHEAPVEINKMCISGRLQSGLLNIKILTKLSFVISAIHRFAS